MGDKKGQQIKYPQFTKYGLPIINDCRIFEKVEREACKALEEKDYGKLIETEAKRNSFLLDSIDDRICSFLDQAFSQMLVFYLQERPDEELPALDKINALSGSVIYYSRLGSLICYNSLKSQCQSYSVDNGQTYQLPQVSENTFSRIVSCYEQEKDKIFLGMCNQMLKDNQKLYLYLNSTLAHLDCFSKEFKKEIFSSPLLVYGSLWLQGKEDQKRKLLVKRIKSYQR